MNLDWRRLAEPAHPSTDPVERLRRRLLLGLLLAVMGLGIPGAIVYELTSQKVPFVPRPELGMEALGLAALVAAYLAARFGTDRIAHGVVLGIPVLLTAGLMVLRSTAEKQGALVLYLLMPILLGAALLTLRQAAAFAAGVLALAAVLPALSPGVPYDADHLNYLAYLLCMGGLVLLVADHRARLESVRQHQLQDRDDQYRLLAENVTDVVVQQDMDLALRYVSPSVQLLFGYTAEEALEMGMRDSMTPESLERAMATFQEYRARAEREDVHVPLMEYEYVRKDGSTFPGELRVAFLRDASGKLTGSLGVLRDISERKRAEGERARLEEHLRQADKMRQIGQLAGGVAHDFNNQLAGIRGSAEVLLQRRAIADDPQLLELTRGIVQAADRSAQLTRQLLAFARRTNAQMAPTDLRALAQEVISMLERSIDKRIRVRLSVDDPHPITLGDAAQLHSALLNVALNARDAMPDGGEILISISRTTFDRARGRELGFDVEPGSYVALSTRDTGLGMDAETHARMFEPFYTTKEKGRGTGMGLPVADGTVRAHGGAIEVVSAAGRGTTVTLYLRAAPDDVVARPPSEPNATEPASGTVMLVDDEDSARNATAALLATLGYRVLSCSGGGEAIDLYRQRHADIHLVVLDVVMADPGGIEVLRHVLAQNPDARVVLVSGYSETAGHADHGARAFLAKPFSLEQLRAALDEARGHEIARVHGPS